MIRLLYRNDFELINIHIDSLFVITILLPDGSKIMLIHCFHVSDILTILLNKQWL